MAWFNARMFKHIAYLYKIQIKLEDFFHFIYELKYAVHI